MPDRYEPASFEAKWRQRWKDANLFRTREDADREKFYCLDFFPYPSGAGLSVGHCRNYVPTDVISRMKYMQGYNVLHPMGFDAFGQPAETAAIKAKRHPSELIQEFAANYRRQLELIGNGYDWDRAFFSSDPDYYKWTEWIFTILFKKGLAYRKSAKVNWDPVDKTVLADEEVIGGLGWRSGAPVQKRELPQWFFKITDYAQELLDDLDDVDWPEGIKAMQRHWIGRSEGFEFSMKIVREIEAAPEKQVDADDFTILRQERAPHLRVFTTRLDTIFGVTFCVIAPEHPLMDQVLAFGTAERAAEARAYIDAVKNVSEIDRQATTRVKTGVFTGAFALNPANGRRVPIFVADYVLMGYGSGAIMAVPGHDERDYEFAVQNGLEVVEVIRAVDAPDGRAKLPFMAQDGVLVNSGAYGGLSVGEAQRQLSEWMEGLGLGERKVNYKLRDWLISRQRYWGCPIPIVYTKEGEPHAVREEDLPVTLPDVENYEPTGEPESPLAAVPDFVNVTDRDGRLGRRETDTMAGFACSSWYFLRFADPANDQKAWDPSKVSYWLPVDLYVGGAEHAVLHLLYARFWTKVLHDEQLVPFKEPFKKLLNQGQVLGHTPYRQPREGEHLEVGEDGILISFEEAKRLPAEEVHWKWVRMSKSKGNVVTPDEAVAEYGADALRIFELFVAPFEQDVHWSNEGMNGAVRFLGRVFKLASTIQPVYDPKWQATIGDDPETRELRRATHRAIQKATQDIERLAFNTYVAALMTYVNALQEFLKQPGERLKAWSAALSEALDSLILLLAPASPHSADEIWESLGREGFTYHQPWPSYEPSFLTQEQHTIAVQVNGKLRATVLVAADAQEEEVKRLALGNEKITAQIDGKEIRKIVYVPQKLVNFVVS